MVIETRSNQDHTMMMHTYNPEAPLASVNFLHITVYEILPGKDFKGQGQYSMVKGQIKVTPCHSTPATPNQCPY